MAVLGRSALLLVVMLVTGGCRSGPEQWGPFRGQVVDVETGMPISGVNVMVSWIREPPSLHFSQWFYDAQEAVTDADGRFEIPRQTRLVTAFVNEPGFGFFAPGYLIQSHEVVPPDGRAYVEPTVVKMRPLKTREEKCKFEPHGIGAFFSKDEAARFSSAIDRYIASLRCAELR
jgi:hypothetical protein